MHLRCGHLVTWRSNEMLTAELLAPPLEFLADAVGQASGTGRLAGLPRELADD